MRTGRLGGVRGLWSKNKGFCEEERRVVGCGGVVCVVLLCN